MSATRKSSSAPEISIECSTGAVESSVLTRRKFLARTSRAAAATAAGVLACPGRMFGGPSTGVAIVAAVTDSVANAKISQWAVAELKQSLVRQHVPIGFYQEIADAPASSLCVLAAGADQKLARNILSAAHVDPPQTPEALALVPGKIANRQVLLACGYDPRALVYALLELADRTAYASEPVSVLAQKRPVSERPANPVRSNMRLFASDVEDKSWFYDRAFWGAYLSMLAVARFNRFNLALGLGYDFTSGIRDAYFHFAYPFLVAVPGYDVRVTGLLDGERERNLEMLRFISDETAARGLDFQLGIWTHAYQWTNSPHANHTIQGLTPENHAAYCRDALRALLIACPSITGVTFRIHGESGVAEGSYVFWKTVFEGLTGCGRRVGLDMHAKGMDGQMIEIALATGLPVTISPKFWAEHMGLPYHQAAIRPTEKPPRERKDEGFFSKSSGSRSFLRYGYGDLLVEGRRYGIVHRIWPGTQRLLLWGDPVLAAAYGRAGTFCGSNGVELFEPLSFKGRKGSGMPGGRDGYADASFKTPRDFEKYSYEYRLWGRLLYNPNADPGTWRRQVSKEYGHSANAVETALSNAGRILPLITTAHLPSAANNNFWPEIYTNMPIVDPKRNHPYGDTPSPKRFGTVSPLDPQLFSTIEDFASQVLNRGQDSRYSPPQVAAWLLKLADTANRALNKARRLAVNPGDPGFRRMAVDTVIQINLGRFFAWKLRAGVLFALHQRTQDRRFLRSAIEAYNQARQCWTELVLEASGVYVSDITFGLDAHLRGHWKDRLPAIDADLADMVAAGVSPAVKPGILPGGTSAPEKTAGEKPRTFHEIMRTLSGNFEQPRISVNHLPPPTFRRGQPLKMNLSPAQDAAHLASALIFYRHANQAEEFQTKEMLFRGGSFEAQIPPSYTDSPFPLLYYFELRNGQGGACMHPSLGPNLDQQPYYVVRQDFS